MSSCEITVFTARRIRTMTPSAPLATAVAVRDGMILEAGTLETLRPWLDAHPHRIDDRFRDAVLMPGFIDPHLHPTLGALLLPCPFITAMEWKLPDRTCAAVRGRDAYLARLAEIDAEMTGAEPLVTWGYHRIWHGEIGREALNAVSATRPIVLWQRSFHEVVANDAAIDWMGLDRADLARHAQVDLATGRFFETGLALAMRGMAPFLHDRDRFIGGLEQVKRAIHLGGHTTLGELAYPLADDAAEWGAVQAVFGGPDVPFRMQFVPRGAGRGTWTAGAPERELERVNAYAARSTDKLIFGNGVKLFADGGFFAELMQMAPPGFIDGHLGEWMMAPESIEALAGVFWHAGKRIHIHCTGDLGVELALDILEKLQWERPRFDHRFTIEHFGVSTPEQARRIKALGALVSANVYYVHELGEAYWRASIGHERASQMARLGSLDREGVPFALHSDFTMAPALPLNSAWVAVNRIGETGEVLGPGERISLDAAMRAITLDAAYVLGMEGEVGSIRAGKKADFTVLAQDPWEVDPMALREIEVLATVFEGRPFPLAG